jgi:voltage-gated potassium channel
MLMQAFRASRFKILVFIFSILTLVIVIGSLMYVIEGPEHGFSSIPRGIYWAIVTLTTVGYGDISPQTNIGQVLASIVMIIGFCYHSSSDRNSHCGIISRSKTNEFKQKLWFL